MTPPLSETRTSPGERRILASRGWAGKTRAVFNRLLMVCLLAIGLWQIGEGSWIYTKARLAQFLLQRAWSRTLAGETRVKPWPWADTWPVARLTVPSQHVDLIVLNGAYGRMLAFGPGYAESSAFPGSPGTTILTGHRDTHFKFLKQLKSGDEIVIETADRTRSYHVVDTAVVESRTAKIPLGDERHVLVLLTCYPFDAIVPGGSLRYVVTAIAVQPGPDVRAARDDDGRRLLLFEKDIIALSMQQRTVGESVADHTLERFPMKRFIQQRIGAFSMRVLH